MQHDGKRAAVAAAAAWFEMNGPDLKAALKPLMTGLLTDAMAIGIVSAQAVTPAAAVAKAKAPKGLNPAASWKPGDALMSSGILGDAGLATAPDPGDAADAASQLAAGARTVAGRALVEGGESGDDAASAGGNLFSGVTSKVAAAAAVLSQITAGIAQAAAHWYLKVGVQWIEWRTDGASACAVCQANADAGPVRLGESFPSGATSVPQHPNCRCITLPAGWVNPPPGTPGTGEPDLEDEAGEEDEGGLGTGDLEDSDAGEAGGEDEEPDDAGTEGDAADDEAGNEGDAEGESEDGEPETDPDFSPLEFADRFEAQDWMAEHTPDLPPEQAEAVDWYTGPGAYEANAPLRNGETLPADVAEQVANLDAAMAPLPADMILARMVDMDAFGGVTDLASLEGRVITDQAFMSTSLGPAIGDAGSEVQMHIAAPRGTPGVVTGTLSGAPSQREIVLARGTSLAVNRAVQDAEGGWQVWLTVVP